MTCSLPNSGWPFLSLLLSPLPVLRLLCSFSVIASVLLERELSVMTVVFFCPPTFLRLLCFRPFHTQAVVAPPPT